MADNLKERLSSLSGKLKVGGAEVGKKVSTSMVSMSGKMKELFRVSTPADKLVEELTSEDTLLHQEGPDWTKIMELCDAIRHKEMNGQEVVRSLKKRLMLKNSTDTNSDTNTNARVQLLTLTLIEACVKNCENLFIEISNEHVLDEMVKIVDDPTTPIVTRDKALKLIEAWGESAPQLRNLPMFEETYKSLKSRGVKFPLRDPESLAPIFTPPQSVATPAERNHLPRMTSREVLIDTYEDLIIPQSEELLHTARNSVDLLSTVLTSSPQQEALQDELTTTLVEQCHRSQFVVQRIVEQMGDNEALLFEALHINDELQKVLEKYEEMRASLSSETIPLSQPPSSSPTTEDSQSGGGSEAAMVSTTSESVA